MYSVKLRIKCVKAFQGGLTAREVCRKYKVNSESSIFQWAMKYREEYKSKQNTIAFKIVVVSDYLDCKDESKIVKKYELPLYGRDKKCKILHRWLKLHSDGKLTLNNAIAVAHSKARGM